MESIVSYGSHKRSARNARIRTHQGLRSKLDGKERAQAWKQRGKKPTEGNEPDDVESEDKADSEELHRGIPQEHGGSDPLVEDESQAALGFDETGAPEVEHAAEEKRDKESNHEASLRAKRHSGLPRDLTVHEKCTARAALRCQGHILEVLDGRCR